MNKLTISLILIISIRSCSESFGQKLVSFASNYSGKKLSVELFSRNIEQTLSDSSTGWGYQIWNKEVLIKSNAGGFRISSVDTEDQNPIPFDVNQRMHIASISKAITAIATAKILEENHLSWDEKIKNYLPSRWKVHPSMENTTFAQLLEMRSGLRSENNAITSSYHQLKELVGMGVNSEDVGTFNYQNASYGLLRVLIAELNGFSHSLTNPDSALIETVSANSYVNYVNKSVFEPAGIPFASCREMSEFPTMMYPFPYDGEAGLISGYSGLYGSDGDLTTLSGGLGWYLSIVDLGKLYSTFYNTNKILSGETYSSLLSRKFPFNKNKREWGEFISGMGMWIWTKLKAKYNCGLNTVYILFPENILVVAFENSRGRGIRNLRARCMLAYSRSFK